jgi:CheY-like chemotaxis protein
MVINQTITNGWNILLVDDNNNIHRITRNSFWEELICSKPINFLSAYSLEEAISILKEFHSEIVIVILDMVMGSSGNEGFLIVDYIYNELKNNKLQVIVRTGYTDSSEVKKIKSNYPQVFILEKGGTNPDLLIQLVTDRITNYYMH